MKVEEYREVLHEDISIAASANMTNPNDEFIQYVTDILSAGEEFDDFIECYYEGVTRQRGNMRIDGYAMDETDGSCCVFLADYHGPFEGDSIKSEEITKAFKKIRYFVDEATKYELYQELEESTEAYEFARTLYYDNENISKFRFYLLTDAYNNQRTKNIKDGDVAGKKVELNVWDISRIFDVISSKTQKESVEIVLGDLGYSGIPCVKAVEYEDVIADIEVMPKYDDIENDEEENDKPENIITYSSYLAVVPGQVLNDLYLEYGSRLLEGNVRSFLSVRGKVNKSIQTTIKNYPEMFFAYNNGIAATATELGIEEILALRLGTNFGGGGRKGELCGAVAGALMVLGLRCGHCDSDNMDSKGKAYSISEKFMNRFIKKNGSVVCRELLGYDLCKEDELKIIKEENLFRTLCPVMVRSAAEILDEMINEGI